MKVPEHHQIVTDALAAGKMVFCEWPLGRNLLEAEELAGLAREKQLRTVIGLQGGLHPPIRFLHDLIRQGAIGLPLSTSIRAHPTEDMWVGRYDPPFEFMAQTDNGATLLSIAVGQALEPLAQVLGEFDSLSGSHILLVDDNAVNRQVVKLFLKPHDVRITEAANGQEALDALAKATFDIVLLDVHMPVMDGVETIKAIRASKEPWSGIPTIALTADAMSGDRERYIAMGMTDYLAKPIDQSELVGKLMTMMAQGRAGIAAIQDDKARARLGEGPRGRHSRVAGKNWRPNST